MNKIQNSENKTVPEHIVLFPDGNRRWATEQGMDTLEGHSAGYKKIIEFSDWCKKRGVKVITAFGFSTENWSRTEREVSYLMGLLEERLRAGLKELHENEVKVRVIGQRQRLPESLQRAIEEAEAATKDYSLHLNLAVSYGGRWDIVQAAQDIIRDGIPADELTEERFAEYLCMADLPSPDLVIRAGGEKRFSNFVLWQAAYAELYFSSKYWPAFTEQDFDEALEEYARRSRRFGH